MSLFVTVGGNPTSPRHAHPCVTLHALLASVISASLAQLLDQVDPHIPLLFVKFATPSTMGCSRRSIPLPHSCSRKDLAPSPRAARHDRDAIFIGSVSAVVEPPYTIAFIMGIGVVASPRVLLERCRSHSWALEADAESGWARMPCMSGVAQPASPPLGLVSSDGATWP